MPKKPTKKELDLIGRYLGMVYEANYVSRKRMFLLSFTRGVMQGIGGFIGATLGAGLLLWIASGLLDVPILGSLLEAVKSVAQ